MPGERTIIRVYLDAEDRVGVQSMPMELDEKTRMAAYGMLMVGIDAFKNQIINPNAMGKSEVKNIRKLLDE